jgi:hypothetical protein
MFVGSAVASAAVIGAALVRIPADWFVRPASAFLPGQAQWVRIVGRVGKNLAGLALVVFGVILAVPGVPGQGILTILLGLMLLDLPGKKKLVHRIVRQPSVQRSIDRIRARFDKPPIVV